MDAVIGALRAVLGIDTVAFEEGLTQAQKTLSAAARQLDQVGRSMSDVGRSMTMNVSAPLAGLGAAMIKVGADFEEAMVGLKISTKATGAQLEELSDLAQQLGKDSVFSATEAAGAFDELAKAGLDAKTILGGAGKAAVDLAAAAGSELEPAAQAVTDAMAQFGLTTKDLPRLVNGVTGAVNESKLSFEDYVQGASQAGGIAAGLGVSFEEFNAVLAATSSNFASGSDAGTSFKTFLMRLKPATDGAAEAMAQIGFDAYDAQGKLKPMSDIAEQLRTGLKGLSEEARNEVLTKMFGSDAMRMGIALMKEGAEGIKEVEKAIAETKASEQAAKRMQGFNAQLKQLGGAFENVAIAVAKSGLLKSLTDFVKKLAELLDKLAATNPAMLQFSVAVLGVAAGIGPALMAIGAMTRAVATLAGLLSGSAFAGLAGLLAPLLPVLIPVGIAVAAVTAAFLLFRKQVEPVLKDLATWAKEALGPELRELFYAAKAAIDDVVDAIKAFSESDSGFAGFMDGVGSVVAFMLQGFGVVAIRAINVLIEALTGIVTGIGDTVRLVAAVLTGDWDRAWQKAKDIVDNVAHTILEIVRALWPEGKAAIDAFSAGVRKVFGEIADFVGNIFAGRWDEAMASVSESTRAMVAKIGDFLLRLLPGGPIISMAVKGAQAVSAAFKRMEDDVTGHSYVPDMVNAIAAWFAKLDAGMVEPAKRATEKTAEVFRALRDQVAGVLQGLQTETEAAFRQAAADTEVLGRAFRAGIIDADAYGEALGRLNQRLTESLPEIIPYEPEAPELERPEPIGPLTNPVADRAREEAAATKEAFRAAFDDIGRMFESAFSQWIETGKFNWRQLLSDMITNWQSTLKVLGEMWKVLSASMNASGSSGGGGNWLSTIVSAAASAFGGGGGGGAGVGSTAGGPVGGSTGLPGFAQGGSFEVGGRAGIDRNVVAFRATRGERVDVSRPGDGERRGAIVFDMRGAVVTEDLLRQAEQIAEGKIAQYAPAIAQGGAALARQQSMRMQRQLMGG